MILFVVVILVSALVLLASVAVDIPSESEFELLRRKEKGEEDAVIGLKRRQFISELLSLQRAVLSLLLVLVVALCVAQWGWILGVGIAVIIALQYGVVARLPFIHNFAQRYYDKFEDKVLATIERYPLLTKITRTITTPVRDGTLGSRDELLHMVAQSGVVLSQDEKQRISHVLQFDSKIVHEVMTPRSVIDSIGRTELVNPLVLDQLHKTGHNRFPVIDGDIDHVVGILHLRNLLTIDSTKKHTPRVDSVMEPKVYYIHEDQTLTHALMAFLRTHHHLFVVVNAYRETVGILTLEDVIECLIGKKILDEFDMHDDLRAVAARNPRKNNRTTHSQDV